MDDTIVVQARGTVAGQYFEAVEAHVRPDLVSPGKHYRLLPSGTERPVVACFFHSKADRDAYLDALEERIFDLNHPVRR